VLRYVLPSFCVCDSHEKYNVILLIFFAEESGLSLVIILGAVGGVVVVSIIVIVLLVARKKRAKNKTVVEMDELDVEGFFFFLCTAVIFSVVLQVLQLSFKC